METDFNPEYWRSIPEEAVRILVPAVNHVLRNHVYTGWNEKEMRSKWRRRALEEINELNGLFPCMDAAAVAVDHLHRRGIESRLRVVTDPKVVELFRQGKEPALHIDAWPEVEVGGTWYGMDIGAGDEYFAFLDKGESPRSEFPDEQVFSTTRPEAGDRFWYRKTVMLVPGKAVYEHSNVPILNLMQFGNSVNLVEVPDQLTSGEFRRTKILDPEEHRIFVENKEYNIEGTRDFTAKWTRDFNNYWGSRIKGDFEKLVPIRYE
jgi:hypothetical protein